MSNLPDDWNMSYTDCPDCGATYHASAPECLCVACAFCDQRTPPDRIADGACVECTVRLKRCGDCETIASETVCLADGHGLCMACLERSDAEDHEATWAAVSALPWPDAPTVASLRRVVGIRRRIAAGEYHQDTLEGDLALQLTVDRLTTKLKE